ncbi:MAG: transcriptional regulator [Flavobacteriaceae bacterium]|nr:transcriptional regulator [Flavobacteriaceae bacterium]|tara:strand:+ start:1267 stop:1638 length:372 start_codon:yes stop_codon:yes gene_type:complete
MLNIDEFLNRLEELMKNHKLNAAAFAEKIGVQRSSVSHILSRRNKPSLEFIFKIQSQFEEVDFDWLLLGIQNKITLTDQDLHNLDSITSNIDLKPKLNNDEIEVTQIIQTYKDGSFRVYLPKS